MVAVMEEVSIRYSCRGIVVAVMEEVSIRYSCRGIGVDCG